MTRSAFQRAVALTAFLSLACLAANAITWLAATGFDLGRATDPNSFITLIGRIGLIRSSLAFDVGSYVLLVPLIAYVWAEFDAAHPARSRMYAAGGLAYSLVGATGAVVLLAAWPPLMRAYASVGGTDRVLVRSVFEAFTGVVYRGMWNTVGAAGLGVWLLGTGVLLRPARPKLAALGIAAGLAALSDSVLVLVGAHAAALVTLSILGVLTPLWILIVAVDVLRQRDWRAVTNTGRWPSTHKVEDPQPSAREETGTS